MLKNLKLLRKSKGISQQKLADAIMVSQQSVNKYENHNIEPDITTLIKIADFFGVSVDYLVGAADAPQRADILKETDLSPDESEMIKKFRQLTPKQKECVANVIESYG